MARRVRNGAIGIGARGFEPPFRNREGAVPQAKSAIAEAVIALVEDGRTLIIDFGTTAFGLRTGAARNTVNFHGPYAQHAGRGGGRHRAVHPRHSDWQGEASRRAVAHR